jgi:hypothetical protein
MERKRRKTGKGEEKGGKRREKGGKKEGNHIPTPRNLF